MHVRCGAFTLFPSPTPTFAAYVSFTQPSTAQCVANALPATQSCLTPDQLKPYKVGGVLSAVPYDSPNFTML